MTARLEDAPRQTWSESQRLIYLDNSATTRALPEVAEAMREALLDRYGNPSSRHRLGLQAEQDVEEARRQVAALLGVRPEGVVFTSGATEANNLAILGTARARRQAGRHVITSRTEHPSVLEAFDRLAEDGFEVTRLEVDRQGRISLEELATALRPETILVSLMRVNNEVGTVQPIDEVAALLAQRHPKPVLHSDVVQAAGKMPLDLERWGVDLASVSAHKLHGPKGVGALFVRPGLRISPVQVGGGQERGLRSGTENVPGIVGFGVAAREARTRLHDAEAAMRRRRQQLEQAISREIPQARINGPADEAHRAPHILSLSLPGQRAEVIANHLEAAGVLVSVGSACSSHKVRLSHVLSAMRLATAEAEGTIRISLSPYTTDAEVEAAAEALIRVARELYSFIGAVGEGGPARGR